VVPGYEDSTFGNIFASYVKSGECSAAIAKSGIEYMADFYDRYEELSTGATPNEKITWDKLKEDTPMFVIESDATIVAPLILRALLECKQHPEAADALIERHLGASHPASVGAGRY
jgi:deoxyhypusine synthase